MRRFASAVAIAAALAACTSSAPKQPPGPPPPAGHVLLGTDVTDGHPWRAYRYKGEGGACVTIVDETERQAGAVCGDQEMAFDFVKTTVWIVPTSKSTRTVRLEFTAKPPVAAKTLKIGAPWPYDYAVLSFPSTDYPIAIVELDGDKEIRRIRCDATSGCRR